MVLLAGGPGAPLFIFFSGGTMRSEKLIALIIVAAVLAITVYLSGLVPQIRFSGSTDDIIVLGDPDKEFMQRINAATSESEQLVAMVTGD